ncbi:hypothetical protein F5Y16DRAFT_395057 [Xylariaceae sp. FL0255]|nr:hypothetical protein F5Y16DRAFT_395057 [Xylariaceae sp. FL0255]
MGNPASKPNKPVDKTSWEFYAELDQRLEDTEAILITRKWPDDLRFENQCKRWCQLCEKRAASILEADTAWSISESIKFATKHNIPLAVHSQGHSSDGFSSCKNGMIIDLRDMKQVKVNKDKMTVTIEGGCYWGRVNSELEEHGLGTVSSIDVGAGVGGSILAGGFGFLTPKHGLMIDNLLEAEIVTADGRIRRCSENENSDLFWAIRGAGTSFGVVTKFKLRVFKQGPAYCGYLFFAPEKLRAVVDFANYMHETQDRDSGMLMGPVIHHHDAAMFCYVFYNGTELAGRQFFQPLIDCAYGDSTGIMPWRLVWPPRMGSKEPPRRLSSATRVDAPLKVEDVERVAKKMWPFIQRHRLDDTSTVIWSILPNAAIRSVAPTATAFSDRDNTYNVCTHFQWRDKGKDGIVKEFNGEMINILKQSRAQYQSAQVPKADLPPDLAYGLNALRIKELKDKYDPNNVFDKGLVSRSSRQRSSNH